MWRRFVERVGLIDQRIEWPGEAGDTWECADVAHMAHFVDNILFGGLLGRQIGFLPALLAKAASMPGRLARWP